MYMKKGSTKLKKRGRPRKDYSSEINQEYHGHRIEKVIRSKNDGKAGPKVRTRCIRCGKPNPPPLPRLRDVKSGHTQSCGCLRRDMFIERWEKKVDQLGESVVAEIWNFCQSASRQKAATSFELHQRAVDFSLIRYKRKLDSLAKEIANDSMKVGELISKGGLHELSAAAVGYVLKTAGNISSILKRAIADQIEIMYLILRWVDSREEDFANKVRRGEFTPGELRVSNGKIKGSLAAFYNTCKLVRDQPIENHQRETVVDFLKVAEYTLSNRRSRLDAFKIRLKTNKQLRKKHESLSGDEQPNKSQNSAG